MPGEKLSLYVHVPFCIKKCNYCDFLSFPVGGGKPAVMERYVRALIKEIEALRDGRINLNTESEADIEVNINRRVKSIYFGGGTPNTLGSEWIKAILCKLNEVFSLDVDAEISMELNPGVYEEEDIHKELAILKEAGINRLSMGLQSADSVELKKLGRIHDFEAFLRLFEGAGELGFENINVDLMTGIPLQSRESFARTLEKVLELKPQHISAYSLIIEEGTPFADTDDETLKLPDEESEYEIYLMTRRILSGKGYRRYEISNYALPGRECAHNLVYWDRGDYLGLGLGAASLAGDLRFSNTRELDKYLSFPDRAREEVHRLSVKEAMEEFMFLGLRKTDGVKKADFQKAFGVEPGEVYGKLIQKLEGLKLLEEDGERLRLTERGMDGANDVMSNFLL